MKFPKAYCEEVKDTISPYKARELFFDETNELYQQKLTFLCPDEKCRQVITPVGIYLERKSKRVLHFRGKEHHEECDFRVEIQYGQKKSDEVENSMAIRNQIPAEFILNTKKSPPLKRQNEQENEEVSSEQFTSSVSNGEDYNTHKEYHYKTTSFENIVDCFQNIDTETLKKEKLTINGITRSYKSWFKNIKYHLDGKGLIYWGTVKEIKSYGSDFAIKFTEQVWFEKGYKSVSIYLTDEQIQNYRKRNLFRNNLEGLQEADKTVLCFFTGAYPEPIEVDHNNKTFLTFEVKIKNLDHITFEFQ